MEAVANAIGRLAVVQGPSWLQMSSRAARAIEGVVSSREVLAAMTEAYLLAEEIRMLSERDEVVVLDNLSTGRFENIRPLRENPRFRYFIGSVDFAGSHTSRHMGRVSRT